MTSFSCPECGRVGTYMYHAPACSRDPWKNAVPCSECNGSGAKNPQSDEPSWCLACNGRGKIIPPEPIDAMKHLVECARQLEFKTITTPNGEYNFEVVVRGPHGALNHFRDALAAVTIDPSIQKPLCVVPREIVANYAQSTGIPRHRRICEAALEVCDAVYKEEIEKTNG